MHVSVLFMRCIPASQKNSPSNNDHKSNTFSSKLSTAVSYLQSFLLQHWLLQSSMVVLTTVALVPQGA